MKYENTEGICPKCGGELDYLGQEGEGTYLAEDVSCNECDWQGTEWYKVEYLNTEDNEE